VNVSRTDVVVVGGGLNGLVAALYLARRKLSVAIVEQQPEVGGGAITTELAPGFRVPALSHALGPIHRDVARALSLDRAGLEMLTPDPALTALGRNGDSIVFHRDPVLTAAAIHRFSPADAGRWRSFLDVAQRLAAIVAGLQRQAPPSIEGSPMRALWPLAGVGWRVRGLSARDLALLARWTTMSVADVVSEWFESDLLKAAIAARAIGGNFVGPRSAGTGWMLLQRLAEDPIAVGSGVTVRGGPGALTRGIADLARAAGVEVRVGVGVSRIIVSGRAAAGVELADGERIHARAVVAAIDPTRAFLELVDAGEVPPTYLERLRNVRARGVLAKVNLALSGLPSVAGLEADPAPMHGRLLVARDVDHLERAFDAVKYGALSSEPWLEVSVPTVSDVSLAPAGQHVMSIYVHCVPRHLRGISADEAREALWRSVMRTIEPHLPGLSTLVLHRELLLPEDLEQRWGFRGGHIFHGEPTLDQSWVARPQLGWSRYQTPVDGLFLASAGTHPGGGLTGMSGLLAAKRVAGYVRGKS
jgi:phytoene dehydrogenase-like protein